MMTLTPEQTQIIRLSILRYCMQALSAGLILAYLKAEGFPALDREQADLQIRYLLGKKLLETPSKLISPEVTLYRATSEGMDYLALQGQQ